MRKIYSIPLLIITLLLIASIIIGTSYSLWIKTNNQKDENVVTTSCFSSTFTEESTINLKNAMPISDTSGLKKTPYTFTLKNNCDVNLKINISLDVLLLQWHHSCCFPSFTRWHCTKCPGSTSYISGTC